MLLSTFLVNNTANSGPGSLRQAILDSNAATSGTNVIDFAIAGASVQTIAPVSPLPAITASVLIDGTSQPGYAGTPLIELSGNNQTGGGDGLTITGSNVTIRGLDINDFTQGAGIHISGTGATDNWIYADFLGTDPTGMQALANDAGLEIDGGATDNLIGTSGDGINDASEQNLLSGNLFAGVWITGKGTSGNAVAGNFIGTDITGSVALSNEAQPVFDSQGYQFGGGVVIAAGASGNRIGTDGDSVDLGNVISGNGYDGVQMLSGSSGNVVAGNRIGTDVTGTFGLGNAVSGVEIEESAGDTIGGLATGAGNVISGNGQFGVIIHGVNSVGDVVWGDMIGTTVTGTKPLGNFQSGVYIGDWGVSGDAASNATIGGTTAGAGNVISANGDVGVLISGSGSAGSLLQGNRIGTDITGTEALGNADGGVYVLNGASNTVGGTAAGAGNVISANGGYGLQITGASIMGNVVQGNLIGTDVTGSEALGNAADGVVIQTVSNTIGGTAAGAGNVISANGGDGLWITGAGVMGNVIQGNLVGSDITGTVALGNAQSGVQIDLGASRNTIGGVTALAGNLITSNGGPGVVVGSSAGDISSIGNQITANRIFGNKGQAIDLGDDGVTDNNPRRAGDPTTFRTSRSSSRAPTARPRAGWVGARPRRRFASICSPAPAMAPAVREGPRTTSGRWR